MPLDSLGGKHNNLVRRLIKETSPISVACARVHHVQHDELKRRLKPSGKLTKAQLSGLPSSPISMLVNRGLLNEFAAFSSLSRRRDRRRSSAWDQIMFG
jgi:hypothetical protein